MAPANHGRRLVALTMPHYADETEPPAPPPPPADTVLTPAPPPPRYLNDRKIKFKEAKVSLVSVHDGSRQYNDDDDDKEANTPAGQLSKYKLTLDPPVNQWIDIDDGLQFMQKQNEEEEGGNDNKTKKKTVT